MKQPRMPKAQRERMEELLTRLELFGPDTLGNPELLELLGAGPGAPTLFEVAHLEPQQLAQRVGPGVDQFHAGQVDQFQSGGSTFRRLTQALWACPPRMIGSKASRTTRASRAR